MRKPAAVLILISLFTATALAQSSLRGRLRPITVPIQHAGVYHVATGTWTHHASLANVTGPDVIYNNTCAPAYYVAMNGLESFQHRSRIPSTSGPTTPSVYYGTARNDEAPGCLDSYTVNGFQIAYCSLAVTRVDWSWDFASSYTLCGQGDMVSQYNVVLTGLPGILSNHSQGCWIVDIDLSGTSGGGIVLSADGDGTYAGPSTLEQFGFSLMETNQPLSRYTGPILAGDYTWTGGQVAGYFTPCSGTDGTIWDNPITLAEEGTGMASNNFFRYAATPGPVSAPSGPGCYDFRPSVHADFWLKLYANPGCVIDNWSWSVFCMPGEGGVQACTTCSPPNPPIAHGRGCDNFGQHTGGAQLDGTGVPQISNDTFVFTSQYENNTAFTILMQGTATTNVVFGAGVRCVAGHLVRLYSGPAGSAANGDPAGTIHRPGPVDPRSIHQASLDRGYDIAAHAPVTLYYLAYYRDPLASPHCNGATFNATEGGALIWTQ
jgi:hypothetical protein